MSSSSSPVGSPAVIPPIITNERDRAYLMKLNAFIDHELSRVDPDDAQQRYTVYKAAFDRIIDHVTAYKPLLTAIKAEYEDCIDTILRGQKEAVFLTGKLKSMASEPSTIHNYRKRADELEQKLGIIKEDNMRLRNQLESLRKARQEKESKAQAVIDPPKRTVKRDRRIIPGLSTEESTDIQLLEEELTRLDKTLRDLSLSQRMRYSPKNIKNSLKDQLSVKVNHRDMLQEQTELLKVKRYRLKVATDAASSWMKLQPPHQTIGDAVVIALAKSKHLQQDKAMGEDGMGLSQGTPNTAFEDDDPTREKEAELMLEYIEKFNELLEDGKYEEAAIHAANSPKGILRTPETLHRFKDLKNVTTTSGRTPLLAFCDALMASVLALGVRPSEFMSLECVKCALEENRLDLLNHWLSQNRLTVTELLGNMVYDYCKKKSQWTGTAISLAQKVYEEVSSHKRVVDCMMRQGRVNQALEYAEEKAKFTHKDYIEILKNSPSPTLAHELYEHKDSNDKSLLPLGQIVNTLLQTDLYDIGLGLLQRIYDKGPHGKKETSAIRQSVFDDPLTSPEQWLDIVHSCQDNSYDEAGLEVLAAVTVLNIMRQATHNENTPSKSSPSKSEAPGTKNLLI